MTPGTRNIISSGGQGDSLDSHLVPLLPTQPPPGQAIDRLSIAPSVSNFYDRPPWFPCAAESQSRAWATAPSFAWQPLWAMPPLICKDSECHAKGDRCGVHGYNVNVLSPWRRSACFESAEGTAAHTWQLLIFNTPHHSGGGSLVHSDS